ARRGATTLPPSVAASAVIGRTGRRERGVGRARPLARRGATLLATFGRGLRPRRLLPAGRAGRRAVREPSLALALASAPEQQVTLEPSTLRPVEGGQEVAVADAHGRGEADLAADALRDVGERTAPFGMPQDLLEHLQLEHPVHRELLGGEVQSGGVLRGRAAEFALETRTGLAHDERAAEHVTDPPPMAVEQREEREDEEPPDRDQAQPWRSAGDH